MSRQDAPLTAALWMMGAIVSFCAMAVAGRGVMAQLDTFELMLYRSIIGVGIVLAIATLAGTRHTINARHFKLHALRNVSHFAGQNLWFAALALIPMAQTVALEFTSPIWVMLLAPFFLSERLTKMRIIAGALGFIGAMMVARPDFTQMNPGIIFALLAAIGFAGSAILTKMLTRHVSVTAILFWLTLMQLVFGLICAGIDGDIAWPRSEIWPWVVLVSITGLSAHFCLTTALTHAPAVTVMPLDFARLPLIAILGMWLFGEQIDPWVIAGAALIFSANYANIAYEARLVQKTRDAPS